MPKTLAGRTVEGNGEGTGVTVAHPVKLVIVAPASTLQPHIATVIAGGTAAPSLPMLMMTMLGAVSVDATVKVNGPKRCQDVVGVKADEKLLYCVPFQ